MTSVSLPSPNPSWHGPRCRPFVTSVSQTPLRFRRSWSATCRWATSPHRWSTCGSPWRWEGWPTLLSLTHSRWDVVIVFDVETLNSWHWLAFWLNIYLEHTHIFFYLINGGKKEIVQEPSCASFVTCHFIGICCFWGQSAEMLPQKVPHVLGPFYFTITSIIIIPMS